MKYVQPFDQPSNPTAPYVDLNIPMGVDGSIPPAAFFNAVQTEIVNVITGAGLTPDGTNLAQLRAAIQAMIPPPTGAPSDASLVHFGTDTGTQNSLVVTPYPVAASVAPGFTIFVLPANSVLGAGAQVNLTINLSGGSTATHPIVASDGGALAVAQIVQGETLGLTFDGTSFRMHRRVTKPITDGSSILGDGSPNNPIRSNIYTRAYGFVGNQTLQNGMNVRSISGLGNGYFQVNLLNALPDTAFMVQCGLVYAPGEVSGGWVQEVSYNTRTTSSFTVGIWGITPLGPVPSYQDFQFSVVR